MQLIPAMQLHRFDMDTFSKFFLPAVLFLLTIAFGLWLSRLGKSYNGILFNFHKLIALGVVIFTVVQFSKTMNIANSPLLIVMLIVAGLCVVALFANGALMSLGKLDYDFTLTIHRVAPVLVMIAMGGAIYLLSIGN
jgi:hypothetical protein